MSDSFGGMPKFQGDLSDHLPPRSPEPPDRWRDRLRHAWFVYLFLSVLFALWVLAIVLAVVHHGEPIGFLSALFVPLPFGILFRVVIWNMICGRDPTTGKRMDSPDR